MSEQQTLDVSAAKAALAAFVEHLKSIPPAPGAIGAGQIVVQPGGKTFATIKDALNSITDASLRKEYTIYLGAGVYEENVVCKPWVFIEGSGPDVTTIRAPLGVTGASNSSIGSLTVDAGTNALVCNGAVNFAVANCVLMASNRFGTPPSNYEAVSAGFPASPQGSSTLSISYSTLAATTTDTLSITVGVVAGSNSFVELNYCKKISAQGGNNSNMGCAAGTGANITLYDCSISTPVWALRLLDDTASMVATDCTIDGKVSPGVVIKNGHDAAPPNR